MSSKTYLTLPVAPSEYDSVQESTFRKTIQDNLQDVANEILDSGNHARKDASLSLRRFQFVPTATQKPSAGEFFNLNVGGSVVVSSILDEDDMASDSDAALATQQSIKAYIDNSGGGSTSLSGLTDVTIASLLDGQYLQYDSTSTQWVNVTVAPGSGVTQVTAGAGLSTAPPAGITGTGTVSMDLLGLQLLTDPGANKVPFYRNNNSPAFDWLLFDSNDFQYSTSTTLSLASGAVGFKNAGSGLVASGTASDEVSVKYTSGSNLIDGAGSGNINGADNILFQDISDSSIVKQDTVANLPFVNAVAGTAPIVSSGGTGPTISLNYTVGLKNIGGSLAVDIETNTHDFDPSSGDTMDASDIVMLFDRGSDVGSSGGTYVARMDQLDLNLMDNDNANFTKNGFNTAGAGLVRLNNSPTSSTITVDYITTSNVISDAFSGTEDVVDAANDRMLIYNVAPEESGEYVQYININQLPFAQTNAIESITANWIFNADITWGDDDALQFGTSVDYWFEYNTTGTQFEFWTSDSNGSGADALLMSVSDGGTVVDFNGQVITPAIRVGGGPQASTGEVKLSYTDTIAWRNATNTADVVALTVDDTDNLLNTSTTFRPDTDGLRDLGTTAIRWRHIYADDITVSSGLVTSVGEATNGGIAISPTSGDVLLGIRLTGTDNYILEAPDQQGVAIATSARVAYSDGSNNVQYGNVSDLPFPSKTGAETISGNWTITGDWSFSEDILINNGLSLQNESSAPAVPSGYHTIYSYNNGSSFEIKANDGTLGGNRNIPLITGSAANDQLLVSTGTDHKADWSSGPGSNELTWNGTDLNIAGTGGFTGDGSGLGNVSADSSTVTNLTTETDTYYPMMVDGASGSVNGFVNSTDLRWKNTATANQLLLADGADADPIIAFINDEDTGIYLSSTGQLAFAIGGVQKAYFRAHGLALKNTATGNRIFDWDGSGDSRITMITDQGGISIGADSSIVILAGDKDDEYVAGRNIVAGTTAENLHLAADANVYIAPNQQLGYTTAKQWVFTTTGPVLPYYDGAVATPTYSFGNDEDTGMWLNNTGVLAFSVGAINRFQIDDSGSTTARAQFDATQVYNTEGARITASGNVGLDWDKYNQVDITNDGTNRIVTIDDNSMQDGGHYVLVIDYTTGNITSWTWSATGTLQWQGGSEPTLPTATAGDRTVITFVRTGGITLGYYADAPA